jgi:hypothetical protein
MLKKTAFADPKGMPQVVCPPCDAKLPAAKKLLDPDAGITPPTSRVSTIRQGGTVNVSYGPPAHVGVTVRQSAPRRRAAGTNTRMLR